MGSGWGRKRVRFAELYQAVFAERMVEVRFAEWRVEVRESCS